MGEFTALYRGTCESVTDPENLGRIKLKVPQVLGDSVTEWAWPCRPAPLAYSPMEVPDVGQGVWVMFEAGDVDLPVWLGVF